MNMRREKAEGGNHDLFALWSADSGFGTIL
nr:hypothetical protein [Bifidobacterium gallicum]